MNPYTGALKSLRREDLMPDDYERVPQEIERVAALKLNGNETARVNLNSRHPLARWAADLRKKKARAKIAASSRRRNRK